MVGFCYVSLAKLESPRDPAWWLDSPQAWHGSHIIQPPDAHGSWAHFHLFFMGFESWVLKWSYVSISLAHTSLGILWFSLLPDSYQLWFCLVIDKMKTWKQAKFLIKLMYQDSELWKTSCKPQNGSYDFPKTTVFKKSMHNRPYSNDPRLK